MRSSNVSRSGLSGTAVSDPARQEIYRDAGYNYRYHDDFRVDDRHNMYRVPPRQRDPMAWDRPGHFWGDHPHYYGYRIHALPPSWRRISHWGMDYYYYNGIYYRPYGGDYVVCRPPFGTPLEAAIDRAILRTLRFAYYYDTYRTYDSVFDYYNVIARQNLIIAQQNARIIARNSSYAINSKYRFRVRGLHHHRSSCGCAGHLPPGRLRDYRHGRHRVLPGGQHRVPHHRL